MPFGRLLKPDEVARAVAYLCERRVRHDDRLDHRLRSAGARLGRGRGAAVKGDGGLRSPRSAALLG